MLYARPLWLRAPTTKPPSAAACVSFSRYFSVCLGLDRFFGPFDEFRRLMVNRIGVGLPPGRFALLLTVGGYHDPILLAAQIDEIAGLGDSLDDDHTAFHVHGDVDG